jgi:putative acetyltransferase
MIIKLDDLSGPEIAKLLQSHLQALSAVTPPESCHALDLAGLRRPEVTFWSAWEGVELVGCGALKELDAQHGELKSMRTAAAHLRKGVASRLLQHILEEARRRRYRRVSLETGSQDAFLPAQRLYTRFGFQPCGPFGSYVSDPNSLFLTLELQASTIPLR